MVQLLALGVLAGSVGFVGTAAAAGNGPDVTVTTTTPVDFGDVSVGEPSDVKTVVVENNGSAPLDLPAADIHGPDSVAFDFPPGGDPTPWLVQPGDSVAFEVEFQPPSTGEKTGYLDVATNVSDRPHVNVTLLGATHSPACAGTDADFDGGAGTADDPYRIATADQLQCLDHSAHLDADARLTSDVDAADTANWYGGSGFEPVGNNSDPFTGSFDGNGHAIDGLTIDRSGQDNVGLFASLGSGGSIRNVTVTNASIAGDIAIGGLVADNDGVVTNSTATGTVTGTSAVGGLVGANDGSVTDSSATGDVEARAFQAGGLVGINGGSVRNSSATGSVDSIQSVGGLVGYMASGSVTTSYAAGTVSGDNDVGGLIGFDNGATVTDAYWDVNATNQSTSAGGTGLTTEEMTGLDAVQHMDGFGFYGGSSWVPTEDYPEHARRTAGATDRATVVDDLLTGDGTAASPYVITTAPQLQAMDAHLDAHYVLGADVDASATATWNGGAGFDPVGSPGAQSLPVDPFQGSFDGRDHAITGLTIDRGGITDVGLFGAIGETGTVESVTLRDATVTGGKRVGGLAGWNYRGTVRDVTASTTVESSGIEAGGVLGVNWGRISNVTANTTVTGTEDVGGLVGDNSDTVTHVAVVAVVSGDTNVGGLVGMDRGYLNRSVVRGSVSGNTNVGGLVGHIQDGSIDTASSRASVDGDVDVGGLVGRLTDYDPGNPSLGGSITDAWAGGSVSGNDDVGGILGRVDKFRQPDPDVDPGTITDVYADTDATGQPATTNGATNLTTARMTGIAATTNVSGLDLTGTWAATDGYPHLRWTVENQTVELPETVPVGGAKQATITLEIVDGSTVTATETATYASNDTAVATVTANGTVVGEGPGTATIEASLVESDTATVTVEDVTSPTADAGANRTVDEGVEVAFDGSNSTDDVGVTSYRWDFGDGTTATGETPTHTYAEPGPYTVTLTVSDAAGHTDTDTAEVGVAVASGGGGAGGGGGIVTLTPSTATQTSTSTATEATEETATDASTPDGTSDGTATISAATTDGAGGDGPPVEQGGGSLPILGGVAAVALIGAAGAGLLWRRRG